MKKQKNKIKFLNFPFDREDFEDYIKVDNPTEFNNLPDGEYLIRGNKKSHSKEYWVKNNVWYLVSSTEKDNGHYTCIAGRYQLFPNLPEKEWELLNRVYSKLSPYWKRAVAGRNYFMEIRNLKRNMERDYRKFWEEYKNNF